MKKNFFVLFLLFVFVFPFININLAHATESWQTLGPNTGLSAGEAYSESIAVDSQGTPYVAFSDDTAGGDISVMKWNGVAWVLVGPAGFSNGYVDYLSIKLDSHDVPYVAYGDGDISEQLVVQKYEDGNWSLVGNDGLTSGAVYYVSMAIDSHDVPYVAYQDADTTKANVLKWNGTSWDLLGGSSWSTDSAFYESLALASDDTPYVAYVDGANGSHLTVKKWNGTSWVLVGSEDFSYGGANYSALALDSHDVPYIAFSDGDVSDKLSVMTFDGDSWVFLGDEGFSFGAVSNVSIVIDSNDTPYVAFRDAIADYQTGVMKWSGTSWELVGGDFFSNIFTSDPFLTISSDDTLYVAYQDYVNSNKAMVKTFVDLSNYESDETAEPISPDSPGDLSTFTNYLKTLAVDGEYWITNLSGSNSGYDSQVYKINKNISKNPNPKYTVNWTGHGDEPEDKQVSISIWDYVRNAWHELASNHCSSDCDLSGDVTGKKYHDTDGNVWVQAKAENAMPAIEIVDGTLNFDSLNITAHWQTNVAGDSEVVWDNVPHDTWQEFLDSVSGAQGHSNIADLETDHSVSLGLTGQVYFMVRSTSAEDGVVTSDVQGPLLASCPFLFTYNGSEYKFVTDVSTSGTFNIGFNRLLWDANPFYRDPNSNNGYVDPLAYAQIPNGFLVPKTEGEETFYDIKASTELNEVDYFDEAKLQTIDHDPSVEVYPDYRENGQVHTISKTVPAPVSVTDQDGQDVLPLVSSDDNIYWKSPINSDPLNHPSYIDIKLSNEPTTPANLKLVIKRGKEGPFPTSSADISRESFKYKNADGVFVDLPTDKNIFVVTREGATHPSRNWVNAEGVQTKVIDLSGLDIKDNTVRLSSVSNIRQWDVDWLAVDTNPDSEVTITTLDPYSADLHYRGISERTPTNPTDPDMKLTEPMYDTLTDLFVTNPISGNATRYGDVTPLLTDVDNKFVIMVQGDELGLKYHVPAQADGTERDFIYKTWDYQKAYSGPHGDTILPLPFNEMSSYPYHEETETYPYDTNQAYIDEYNTRLIDRSGYRSELDPETLHHSLNTDYLNLSVAKGPGSSGGGSSAGAIASFRASQQPTLSTDHPVGNQNPSSENSPSTGASDIQKVLKDLKYKMTDPDVKILQSFLISQAKGTQAEALKKIGATGYFGKLTQSALAEWQKGNGITPASGYFGPKTRAKIKELGL